MKNKIINKYLVLLLPFAFVVQLSYSFQSYAESFSLRNGWEVNLNNKIGHAIYRENESTLKSKWSNFYYRLDLGVDNFADEDRNIKLLANFGFFIAPTDTETWHVSGVKYQTNDMDFFGINQDLAIGYQFKISNPRKEEKLIFTPLLGYGYKRIKFKRTNFNVLNIITSREVVSEIYDIHYLSSGFHADYYTNEKWKFFSNFLYGYIFSNKADNSALGTIDGEGGSLFTFDVGMAYSFNDKNRISFGGFAEFQRLKGGETATVIWPDNDFNSYGALMNYSYSF
jgi:hypothetical protein